MDKNAFTLGFRFFGRIGVEPGYKMVAAITLARASKSVFLCVVTICIVKIISQCRKKSKKKHAPGKTGGVLSGNQNRVDVMNKRI
jgi:hypothetical protein